MNEMNLPEHWKYFQLKEAASLRRENVDPKDSLSLNFVGLEHIDSGESKLKRWGDASGVKSSKNHFYPDDVLYGKLRSYLDKAVIAEMEGICSTDILVFTAELETAPKFLVYLLHSHAFKSHAVATSTGISHPRTSWDSLGKFTFALPPIPEQRSIAHILHTIQEAKFTRQREIALERECKAALMDFLFSHGTKGEPRKQTEIGEIPESWEVINLEKLCECLDSKRVPIKQSERNDRKGKVPYYGASGQIDWIDDYLFDESLLLVAEDGENLVSRKLPIAYSIEGQSWVNNHAHVLRVIDINQFYLEYYFNSFDLSPYLTGTTRPKLNKTSLLDISVPRPSSEETDRIALMLVSCDTKIAALEREVELIDELFHAMLEELMIGKRSAVPLIDAEL